MDRPRRWVTATGKKVVKINKIFKKDVELPNARLLSFLVLLYFHPCPRKFWVGLVGVARVCGWEGRCQEGLPVTF